MAPTDSSMLTKEDLIRDIRAMGIAPTDTVLIHISLRSIGKVEGGADTVIDAFQECLAEGLLLVPTHTWANVNREHPVYDVRSAVPCIGTLPRVAAFRKDGFRSLHPTHSLWGTGKGAEDYLRGEENAPTPGFPGFAWDRLAQVNAKILLIGVAHDRDTYIHSVEEAGNVPDRIHPEPFEVTIIDHNGQEHRHPYASHFCSKVPDVSAQYLNFEKPLTELGAQTMGKLGNAEVRIVDARRCREVLLTIFSRADRDLCLEFMDIPEAFYQ